MMGHWTLEDATRLADGLPAIVGGLVILAVVVFLLRAPRNMRRFAEYQAQQLAQRRTTAARLGLEPRDTAGTEKVGPFRRFAGPSRVNILFEGERNGFATTVLVERISRGDGPETPDGMTTMVCFASPDFNLPAFSLAPAIRMPAIAEAAMNVVAKALKPLVSPGAAPQEEVDFDDQAFWPAYSVRVAASSLADGLAARDIKEVFAPTLRGFFVARAGWSVEGLRDRLLLYRDDVEEAPERMPAFLEEGLAIAERFRSSGGSS